MLDASHNCKHG